MLVTLFLSTIVALAQGAGDTTIPDTQAGALYNDASIPKYERDSSCKISSRNGLFRDCCKKIPGISKECLETCSYTGGASFQSYIGQVHERCGTLVTDVFACSTDDPARALACCEGKLRIAEPNLRQPMPTKCLDICKGGAMTPAKHQAIFSKDREQPCWDFKTDLKSCIREFKFCDPNNPPPQAQDPWATQGDAPGDDDAASGGDEVTPGGDGAAPGDDEVAPGGDGAAPGDDEAAPGGDETAPGGEEAAPGGDETAPDGDEAAPGGDEAAPGGDETAAGGDEAAPGDDETAPGDDEAAPGGDEAAPGDDESAPGGDEAAPGDDESAPGGDEAAGGEEPAPGSSAQDKFCQTGFARDLDDNVCKEIICNC